LTTQGLDAEASAALANESANEKLRLALRLHDNARVLALADAVAGHACGSARNRAGAQRPHDRERRPC